jgi:transposase
MSAYAPAMMVRVLLYGYATGVYSSRKIRAKTYDDVVGSSRRTNTRTTARWRSFARGT